MVGQEGKLTARGLVHDTLTLVLAGAITLGVGALGFHAGKEVERFTLVSQGACRMSPMAQPAHPTGPGAIPVIRGLEERPRSGLAPMMRRVGVEPRVSPEQQSLKIGIRG